MKILESELQLSKKNVFKQSAVIQAENNMSLVQRKSWNILLANAYQELCIIAKKEVFTEEDLIHTVSIKEFATMLNIEETNYIYFKNILRGLTSISIEYNLLKKDKENNKTWESWESFSLLSYVKIEKGIIHYSYPIPLIKKLANPKMYARFGLISQQKFKSKHGLAMFELFTDYHDSKTGRGETPWMNLSIFRKMMALSDEYYLSFKYLNKDVIKKGIKEVDLIAPFTVECLKKRTGRIVTDVKFITTSKNKETLESTVVLLNEKVIEFIEEKKEIINLELFKKLESFGISETKVKDLLKNYSEDRIKKNINHIISKKSFIKEESSGLLIDGIEKDYASLKKKNLEPEKIIEKGLKELEIKERANKIRQEESKRKSLSSLWESLENKLKEHILKTARQKNKSLSKEERESIIYFLKKKNPEIYQKSEVQKHSPMKDMINTIIDENFNFKIYLDYADQLDFYNFFEAEKNIKNWSSEELEFIKNRLLGSDQYKLIYKKTFEE